MRINHNISAQLANINLKRADDRMSASLQRLSSGYKINKAAEDAAGMAISNKMRTQIRALDQASRNAGDGISVIQTAEGALSEIESIFQRCRELSVQAANDTYTIDDRESAQKEVDELLEEVDRIARETEFNGKRLLDGSNSRVVTSDKLGVQVMKVSESVEAGKYKLTVDSVATAATGTLTCAPGSSVTINDVTLDFPADATNDDIYNQVLSVCEMMDIEVAGTSPSFTLTTKAAGANQELSIKSVGDTAPVVTKGQDAEISLTPKAAGDAAGFTGTEAVVYHGDTITITNTDGFEMELALEGGQTGDFELTVYDTGSMKLQIGANEKQELAIDFSEISCRSLQLREQDGDSFVNLCTQRGASLAITSFDNAIQSVSAYRSMLGAYENRLETTTASLDITSENVTQSMSRIMDTNMATAMTQYTQESVLSEAATSMLAQANNRPQKVMSLLQS